MLLQRIITGIILAATSLAAIFYLNEMQFAVFIGIFTTLAAWEWSRLAGWEKLWQQILYAGFVGLLPVIFFLIFEFQSLPHIYNIITKELIDNVFFSYLIIYVFFLLTSPILWGVILIQLINYQLGKNSKIGAKNLLGFWVLPTAGFSLIALRGFGIEWLLFLLGLVWVSDIGAFFVGRAFGKHKLADKISPGKTIEGALGALLFGELLAAAFVILKGQTTFLDFTLFIGLSLITVIFSIVGDLLESLLKREKNMKDSSQLLPGHGGFLDRLDSIIAAAPIFLTGILILGFVVIKDTS
jgi:phosphatidate cytidylyltransferase